MPAFRYTARDATGTEVHGRIDATGRRHALDRLRAQGLAPVRLEEGEPPAGGRAGTAPETAPAGIGAARSRSYGPSHALPFLQALAGLVSSGIQVGDAVKLLSRRLTDPRLQALAADLWSELSQGRSLSGALAARPQVFDPATVHLIEAGEATGNLSPVVERLVEDMENRREVRRKLVAAMAYPLLVMAVAFVVILIFLLFLMPRIESLLQALRGKLPLPTRLLIGLADTLVTWGPVALALGVVAGIGFWWWRRRPEGRLRTDGWLLRTGWLGGFLRNQEILRLAQTLGLLLENGISTLPALAMTERTLHNRVFRSAFAEARAKIAEGAAISGALRAMGQFPPLVIDILTVGESTGSIVPSLREIARVYRRETTRQVNLFLNVVSIAVLLLAFAFVALVAFGIILAVLQLSSSLRVR